MKLLFCFLLVLLASYAWAEQDYPKIQSKTLDDFALTLRIERLSFNQGERFLYTLSTVTPNNVVVNFEAIDDYFGEFKVIERRPKGPIAGPNNTHSMQRQYLLQPERLGTLLMPALGLAFYTVDKPIKRTPCLTANACPRFSAHDPGPEITFADTRKDMQTDALEILVIALPLAETSAPAADAALATGLQNKPVLWLGIVLLVLLVPLVVWGCWQRRLPITAALAAAVPDKAQITTTALQALSALRQQNNNSNNSDSNNTQQTELFYEHLAAIIRTYLSQHIGMQTHAKTTEELLLTLEQSAFASQQQSKAEELLHHCDQVRFAAYRPSNDDIERVFQRAKHFVEQNAV